jgi:hypothetical protein
VETITAHALRRDPLRQGKTCASGRLAHVEGGIEAAHLRQAGAIAIMARTGARLCGRCSGASGISCSSWASTLASSRCGPL